MAVSEPLFLGSLDDLDGKVAIVTGGAGTIGYQSALYLAAKGCKVYIADMASRLSDAAKAPGPGSTPASMLAGAGRVVETDAADRILTHVLDLGSVAAAAESAHRFLAQESRLDIVIAAAAVMHISQSELSPDGWERTWAITHLGHFVFLNTLLPLLKKCGTPDAPSRISIVASNSYETAVAPDYEQLRTVLPDDFTKRGFLLRGVARYQVAKLCNIYYVQELAKRLQAEAGEGKHPSMLINCCHPGVNGRTHLGGAVFSSWLESLIKGVVALLSHAPRDCAKTGVYLAAGSEIRAVHVTGTYWQPEWTWLGYWGRCCKHAYTPLGQDVAQREECWRRTEEAVAEAQSRAES